MLVSFEGLPQEQFDDVAWAIGHQRDVFYRRSRSTPASMDSHCPCALGTLEVYLRVADVGGRGHADAQVLAGKPKALWCGFGLGELVERGVYDIATGKPLSAVAALGITSLTPHQAGPEQLATYVRGQWSIESNHWIRDAIFREDASTVRTGSLPQVLASMRNSAIGTLRLNGTNTIASGLRRNSRDFNRPIRHLGLQPVVIN